MAWIDIILTIIIVALVLQGIIVGLVRGVFDIVGIIAGYVIAINFSHAIKLPHFIAFFLSFIIVAVLFSIIGRIISKLLRLTPVGIFDRILGGALGLIKGVIISFIFLIIIMLFQKNNNVVKNSELAPLIIKSGLIISQFLPEPWYRQIENIVVRKRTVVQTDEVHYFSL